MADYGDTDTQKTRNAAMLVYILMLAATLFGVTALVGVIIAYIYRDDAPPWLQGHFQLQVRTFWLGLLFTFIGILLLIVVIGKVILLVTFIWWLVRLIKGVKYLSENRPYPNPAGFGF